MKKFTCLRLESLEERITPHDYFWTGNHSESWTDWRNWDSTTGQSHPGDLDTATFNSLGSNRNCIIDEIVPYRVASLTIQNNWGKVLGLLVDLHADVVNIYGGDIDQIEPGIGLYLDQSNSTMHGDSYISGGIFNVELFVIGTSTYEAELHLGGLGTPKVGAIFNKDIEINAYGIVNWTEGHQYVSAGKKITNYGEINANAPSYELDGNGGNWELENRGNLNLGRGLFEDCNITNTGNGTITKGSSSGLNNFYVIGSTFVQESAGNVEVEYGSLLITANVEHTSGEVTTYFGASLYVYGNYSLDGGTLHSGGLIQISGTLDVIASDVYVYHGSIINTTHFNLDIYSTLVVEHNANYWGQVNVSGTATLAGDFRLLLGDYPTYDQYYEVFTFGTKVGTFKRFWLVNDWEVTFTWNWETNALLVIADVH